MKLLIIDDEPLIRRSLSRVFKQKGYTVFEAADGVEGLKSWKKERKIGLWELTNCFRSLS